MRSTEVLFVNGNRVSLASTGLAGASLLVRARKTFAPPAADGLPFLFCGNGSCRDCNVCIDGIPDVPSCRVPLAPGISIRQGDAAGEENALSRHLEPVADGDVLPCDVAVVGGGAAGLAAARRERDRGRSVVVFEARAPTPRPVGVVDQVPLVFENGRKRRLHARTLVLATGCRDVVPPFPGSFLPGVFPLDLAERYVANGRPPGRRVLVAGIGSRAVRLASRLSSDFGCVVERIEPVELVGLVERVARVDGEVSVENARTDGGARFDVDTVVVEGRREPSLAVAKALGCRTRYAGERGFDVLEVDASGRTSVEGVEAVGSLVAP